MAKQSGLGQLILVDGYDVSGDTQSYSNLHGGPAVYDMTGIDKYAFERQGGRRDGGVQATTFFNPGALDLETPGETGSHYLLRPITLTDRIVTVFQLQSTDGASVVGKQGTYDPTVAADGSLLINVDVQANGYGLEWGDQLTAGKVTHTEADETTSVDLTAATAFGAQAYLHVTDFDGTDATIAIQSSSDNGAGDAFANVTGLVFDQITTGPQAQRKETTRSAAIERYLRVATTTTGGFDSITFAVMVVKNQTEVLF